MPDQRRQGVVYDRVVQAMVVLRAPVPQCRPDRPSRRNRGSTGVRRRGVRGIATQPCCPGAGGSCCIALAVFLLLEVDWRDEVKPIGGDDAGGCRRRWSISRNRCRGRETAGGRREKVDKAAAAKRAEQEQPRGAAETPRRQAHARGARAQQRKQRQDEARKVAEEKKQAEAEKAQVAEPKRQEQGIAEEKQEVGEEAPGGTRKETRGRKKSAREEEVARQKAEEESRSAE